MGIVFLQRRPSCSLLQGEERRISETPQGNEWGVCGGLFLGTAGLGAPYSTSLKIYHGSRVQWSPTSVPWSRIIRAASF